MSNQSPQTLSTLPSLPSSGVEAWSTPSFHPPNRASLLRLARASQFQPSPPSPPWEAFCVDCPSTPPTDRSMDHQFMAEQIRSLEGRTCSLVLSSKTPQKRLLEDQETGYLDEQGHFCSASTHRSTLKLPLSRCSQAIRSFEISHGSQDTEQDSTLKFLSSALQKTGYSDSTTPCATTGFMLQNPLSSFPILQGFTTPRPPTDEPSPASSCHSTCRKSFAPGSHPAKLHLALRQRSGCVWWGSFGAEQLTNDLPIDIDSLSLRSELVSLRGYSLQFHPLKANLDLPLLVRRERSSCILRADLVPAALLSTALHINSSHNAPALQRRARRSSCAYDGVIKAAQLRGIPLFFATSSVHAHLGNRLDLPGGMPAPLCIATMLPCKLYQFLAILPLNEEVGLAQLESLFLYILAALRPQLSCVKDQQLDDWKQEIKRHLGFWGGSQTDSPPSFNAKHLPRLTSVTEETERGGVSPTPQITAYLSPKPEIASLISPLE